MIDLIASVLGMIGSTCNMKLSPRLQMIGIALWLISDLILIYYLWNISGWLVAMYLYYCCTCSYGIYVRWGLT